MKNVASTIFDTAGLSADEVELVEIERKMALAQNAEAITGSWDDQAVYFDFGAGNFPNKAEAHAEIARQFENVTNLRTRILELEVRAEGSIGYAFSRQNFVSDSAGGGPELNFVFRETDIFLKKEGRWRLVHQHLSVPTDLASGSVVFYSEVSDT
ncbi:nuclear transport factor 2 family protein [Rhodococcus koreensis]|uniref:nuclear transport factor 2 family protein n=1 Tax=Rhodococcus koreensis TaxID=99653 RepID=UPI0036D784A8